jgi:hypothetical protein
MNSIISKIASEHEDLIAKISALVGKLAEQQDLMLNAKYMLHNM